MTSLVSLKARLLFAALLGLAVAASAWLEMNGWRRRLESRYAAGNVLVARKYIPPGKILSADLVESRAVPFAFQQPAAITDLAQLRNRAGTAYLQTRAGFLKGEQITGSKLTHANEELALGWSVPEGFHAVGLRLRREDAVAGFLNPGDRVNVVWVGPEEKRKRHAGRLIFEHVMVAGVQDRRLGEIREVEREGADAFPLSTDSTLLTLLLPARDVPRLALASETGRIVVSLAPALSGAEP